MIFCFFSWFHFVPAEWFAKRAGFFLNSHRQYLRQWYTLHFQNCFPILSLHNLISLQRAGGHLINNWCWLLFGVPTFLRACHFIRTICCRRPFHKDVQKVMGLRFIRLSYAFYGEHHFGARHFINPISSYIFLKCLHGQSLLSLLIRRGI